MKQIELQFDSAIKVVLNHYNYNRDMGERNSWKAQLSCKF